MAKHSEKAPPGILCLFHESALATDLMMPWNVERNRLRPIAYRYQLGAQATVETNTDTGQPN